MRTTPPLTVAVWLVAAALGCRKSEPAEQGAPATAPSVSQSAATPTRGNEPDPHLAFSERSVERAALVREGVEREGVKDSRVIAAMRKVPRHAFVPEAVREEAYENRPLPIGHGQTISQPYIVAAMTEAAKPKDSDKCLEIGTGSGYQAAVLAEVCREVYSIEYLPDVAKFGADNLRRLGYSNVRLRVGDGYRGWPDQAPFDVVLVTAAPNHVPRPLLEQLASGGRLVIPVGPEHGVQRLERWTRVKPGKGDDAFEKETLMGVRFVPFLGEAQQQ